ncbi:MAG TPA: flagellar basal-body MS-ring/collar protein FliF [Xanthomonadaceae bacterium]|nr:flagellar basal-body MS-ring/collar protein FliF [Xanthomonadaceae bacterium]
MTVFNDFMNNYSKPARTGLLLGAALLLIGLAAASWWLFTPRYQLLFGNLRESSAAEVTKSLAEWKVPYRFTDGGAGIEVPADQVYDTRMKLVSAGVPSGGHVGFELFDHSDFGVTEFAQRVNYQRALQGELERSIAALPGVEVVRVHLTIRRPGLFVGQDDSSKASVAITMTPGEALNAQQVGGIRNLVASAVDGLSPKAVVVLGPAGVLPGGSASGGDQGGLLAQNEEQAGYEARVRERISDLLSQVFHIQTYRVSVDVRLNFDQDHKVSEHLVEQGADGNGLLVRKHVSGAGAVAGAGVAAEAGKDSKDSKEAAATPKQEDLDYAHGTEREEYARAPGRVERLSIAVLVPPTLDDAQMERLRQLVTAAAGLDDKRGDRLEITSVSDAAIEATPTVASPRAPEPASGRDAFVGANDHAMRDRLPTMLLVLVGLAGLVVGVVVVLLFRPRQARLRAEERDAVLKKLRSWLAEDGTAT